MKLTELQPQFLKWKGDGVMGHVDALEQADGICFLCPLCFTTNAGPVGTHVVICWFEGKVPDDVSPGPGRWNPTGTGYGDLSFVPGQKSNSVQLTGGCNWHGHVTNGEVTIL
jgi:hypothetical protein